jgi:hypothetical protein
LTITQKKCTIEILQDVKFVDGEHVKIKKSEFKEIKKKSLYAVKPRCARVARYGIPSEYNSDRYNECNVDVTSISGAIRVISIECMIANGLKIPQEKLTRLFCTMKNCDENEDEDYEQDESNLYVFKNNVPIFIIDQLSWVQFCQLFISGNDNFIVLEWSRYLVVFDINKKACIYLSDCEGNGPLDEICGSYWNCDEDERCYENGLLITGRRSIKDTEGYKINKINKDIYFILVNANIN